MLPPAETVARALSARRQGNGWIACCPAHDDKAPSMTISTGRDGRTLLHCWSGCSFEAVAAAVEAITGEGEEPRKLQEEPSRGRGNIGAVERALRIWGQARPLCEVSKLYLTRRGILAANGVNALRSAVLAHHETGEMVPAIIVPRHNDAGNVVGIQRIFLDEADGTKYRDGTAKMSLGEGGVSMLSTAKDGIIILAEGPESALAASLAFGIPAWACCGGFPQRAVKWKGVQRIFVVMDHDKSGNSQRKAEAFISANKSAYTIEKYCPKEPGEDIADEWVRMMIERESAGVRTGALLTANGH